MDQRIHAGVVRINCSFCVEGLLTAVTPPVEQVELGRQTAQFASELQLKIEGQSYEALRPVWQEGNHETTRASGQ